MRTIRYNVSREKLISRLPSLFAYIEDNAYGVSVLHKATDDMNGTYGKIVENVCLPYPIEVNGETMFYTGDTVSYRTLMTYYYEYQDVLNSEFVAFVETAIGKREVTDIDFEECDLCPTYIYLADAKGLYDKYVKMKKKCDFYTSLQKNGETDSFMCCLCERFKRMGGETMIEKLKEWVDEAETIAEEYYDYAKKAQNGVSIDFNVNLFSTSNDLGLVSPYIEEWVAGKKYCFGDRVYYGETYDTPGKVYMCTGDTTGVFNDTTEQIEFDKGNFTEIGNVKFENCGNTIEINGTCDTKLASMRRNKEYLNEFDERETPDVGTDWLFYYRVGRVISFDSLNDDLGNIMQIDGETNEKNDLAAYGDIITDITADQDNREITFTYVLGGHLIKKGETTTTTDDDGNTYYYFKEFEWDSSDIYHGVIYTETYTYEEDSELDALIKGGEFDNYVNGKYDNGENIRLYEKYEFITNNNTSQYSKRIGYQEATVTTSLANFTARAENTYDLQEVLLFREDYYNGISFAPVKDVDVYVDRGVTATFERHIKLGEVKTLEDMENYSNGGFFNLQEG